MDPQPSGSSPSSSSSGRRKARKRPWNSDKGPPRLGSGMSLRPRTQPNSPGPSASAGGATTSQVVSSPEESRNALDKDSKSSAENSVTSRKSPGTDEEHGKEPLPLANVNSLNGRFTGATLDYRLPCTATEGTTCQIVGHLSAWNEFLCLVSWQLREMPGTSGKLSLVFSRKPNERYRLAREEHLVTLLACQLLRTHRCVAHVELDVFIFRQHHKLLSDALRASPFITSVKLTFCGWCLSEGLAAAALSGPHLKALEYEGDAQHTATLDATLCAFLQTTTSLTALRVSSERLEGLSSKDFFGALAQNCSLKELVLPSRLIAEAPPSAQAAFAEWLTNSVSLTSLTVLVVWGMCRPPSCILYGLLGNRSIVAVDFHSAEVDRLDFQLISKIFEQNNVLRSFKMSYESEFVVGHPEFVQGRPGKADYGRCLKALIENQTLEQVALPIAIWDEHQWKELFEALPAKENLRRVSIEAIGRAPSPLVAKLCAALKETGADEKVSFNADLTAEEFDERFACKAFPKVLVCASDRGWSGVCGILERMPSLGHITRLTLNFDLEEYRLDSALSSALATFLGATRTLKTLALSTFWDTPLYEFQEALMKGLAANTSLREVRIGLEGTKRDFSVFTEPLADAINASANISRVVFEVGPDRAERAFLRRLSTRVTGNYTLLSVTMLVYMYKKLRKYSFEVMDVTRRNCGLLSRAADFARGARRDRHCAMALERMHCHPELVEEVARLEKVDQARAAVMVRDGLRSIEGIHEFMRLAGVVQERVTCHARKDGRTQLDSLNEHCWSALRRYLKLYDIIDFTTGVPAQ